MSKEFNYSFIIPHKNCPDLLQRCVDSIPERDDVQVIVVDDNSDEGKKPSLKEHKNLQVVLLNASQSKGAGRARNVGLEHAKGKWFLFADADDYYTDYLPTLLDKYADDETTDIVYLNACIFDDYGEKKEFKTAQLINNYLNGTEDSELRLRYGLWTPWSRMIKSDIVEINKIRYDEVPATNDKMFCLYCSFFAKSIAVEEKIIYNYYKPKNGSQTDRKRNSQMLEDLLEIRFKTISLYEKVGYKMVPSFITILFRSKYAKGISFSKKIYLYKKYLTKSGIPFWKDFKRFCLFKLRIYKK